MYRAKMRKSSNRDRILECIFRNPGISRTSIAEITEITPATTTTTVASLIEDGIVVELGEKQGADNTFGRRRIALDINSDYAYTLGIEFNQKALYACITNLKGQVIKLNTIPYSAVLSEHITAVIIEQVRALLDDFAARGEGELIGLGIAVPGHMDKEQNRLVSNHSIWHDFDASKIRADFSLPVVLENNARCMALGQYLFHPENSPDHFAFFHVGLGMFCANIVDGELFLGNAYVSGEIGHTIVVPDGRRCACGKYGCLQTVASERYLLENARKLYEYDDKSLLRHLAASKEELTIGHITTAYTMGDAAIGQAISQALKYLGIATSNIAILMNPEKIFLHGQLFDAPEIYAELMDLINRQLLFVDKNYVNTVDILPYSPVDGAVGGAALAVWRCFLKVAP